MAEKMQSINDLMITGLTYVLDFENKVSEQAKKMAEASTDPEVKQVFEQSVTKGKEYAQRVQEAFSQLGVPVKTNDNKIAEAMINEVEQMIAHTDASPVRDAALIVAANQMQLYRVSVYGSLAHYATLVGKTDAAQGLKQNLDDSKGGDEKLTRIGEGNVNQKAAHATA
ncbi:MAG: DUF892 family protein [Acidobacteriota bacterium]|nr:DUF892 family protein [Acidobacteriota bacterium]